MRFHPTAGDDRCRLRGPRRLLLVGGLLVPAVVVGPALVALPAVASPGLQIGSKALLAQDLSQATATPTTLQLTADLVPVSSSDSVALPANATATLDLAGHHLSLDTIALGTGSTLHVIDSAGTGELDVDGDAPATPVDTETPGIGLASNATLDIDAGTVLASGGAGSAGIGTPIASAVTGAAVTVDGTAVVTATGGQGGTGIGGGLAGSGVTLRIGGTARVTAHSGTVSVPGGLLPSAIGVGAAVGALTVDPTASLTVPADSVLRILAGATVLNNGLIDVEGSVLGGGILRNAGELVSVNGRLSTLLSGISLLGDVAVYRVVVDLAGGAGAGIPTTIDVVGRNLLQLSAWVPVKPGLLFGGWTANGTAVTDATDLATVAVSNVVGGVSTNVVTLQAVWIQPITVLSGNQLTVVSGQPVNWQILTGGTSPTVVLIGGALPNGVSLSNTNVGLISGVAQNAGVYDFTLAFTGPAQSAIDKGYELVVQDIASTSSSSNANSTNSTSTSTASNADSGNTNADSTSNAATNSSSNSGTSATSTSTSSSTANSSTTSISDTGNTGSGNTSSTTNDSASNSSNSSSSNSDSNSDSNSTTTTTNNGISQALTKQSSMTAEYAKSLHWSLKGASRVAAKYVFSGKLPHGVHYDAKSVRIVGTPKQVGTYSFSVKAVSSSGSMLRHYSLVVPKVVVFGHRVSTTTTTSGGPVAVTLTKLQLGEHFTLSMGGKVVYRGVAKHAGSTKVTVHVEHTAVDRTEKLTISTSRSLKSSVYSRVDVIELTALAKTKHLVTTVKGGVMTVTGLAPNERVRLLVLGVVVATGTADADGVFVSRKLKPGRTVTVQGSTTGRAALCRVVG